MTISTLSKIHKKCDYLSPHERLHLQVSFQPFLSDQFAHDRMVDVVAAEEDVFVVVRQRLETQVRHLHHVTRHHHREGVRQVFLLEVVCE